VRTRFADRLEMRTLAPSLPVCIDDAFSPPLLAGRGWRTTCEPTFPNGG
jgi:hypothetical protein